MANKLRSGSSTAELAVHPIHLVDLQQVHQPFCQAGKPCGRRYQFFNILQVYYVRSNLNAGIFVKNENLFTILVEFSLYCHISFP